MSAHYFAGPNPPDAPELRVLGSLIEKRRTTPDGYPLSVNSLRLACNQATNRDPVVQYDEQTVIDAAASLGRRGWIRFASGRGSRARKYRHVLDEALSLGPDEEALLCVLMLRGAQTPGELKQRSDRLHHFAGLAAVEQTLQALIDRDLVLRLPRRPGQKEQRYVQLLDGGEEDGDASSTVAATPSTSADSAVTDDPPVPVTQADPGAGRASAAPREASSQSSADSTPAAVDDGRSALPYAPTATTQGREASAGAAHAPALADRVEQLELEVARLRADIARLHEALGG